jgi:uncharacterized protein DUF6544
MTLVILSIVLILILALLSPLIVGWWMNLRRAAEVRKLLRVEPGREVFDASMVRDLPAPAQRYLLHAIRPGTPLATSLKLAFEGSMQFGPQSQLWPLAGQDIVITPQRGFIWCEQLRFGPVPRHGILYYAKGDGRVMWSYLNLLMDPSKMSGKGPDTAKSMLGRFLSKLIWIPSALLPQPGVRWEAVDDEHARVVITFEGETVPLTLKIDPEGRLEELTFPRWGAKNADGSYSYFVYGVNVQEEMAVGGYTIPSRVSAMWCYGDADRQSPLTHRYQLKQIAFS